MSCAAFEEPPSDYAWNDVDCLMEFCVVCASQTQPRFRLRGLCKQKEGAAGGLFYMETLIDDATRKYRFRLRFVRIHLNLFVRSYFYLTIRHDGLVTLLFRRGRVDEWVAWGR